LTHFCLTECFCYVILCEKRVKLINYLSTSMPKAFTNALARGKVVYEQLITELAKQSVFTLQPRGVAILRGTNSYTTGLNTIWSNGTTPFQKKKFI
jgi:hypothetical protein